MSDWDGLTPPYATIVADPPWAYDDGWPPFGDRAGDPRPRRGLAFSSMSVWEIAALHVGALAAAHATLWLWTTNRYLLDAYTVAEAWGFKPSQLLTWCKQPMGLGPGGAFAQTTEHVLYARRGRPRTLQRVDTTWWQWTRTPHSTKPAAFGDIVEQVSPGPYVELFARQPRLGWDHWGHGYELPTASGGDGGAL